MIGPHSITTDRRFVAIMIHRHCISITIDLITIIIPQPFPDDHDPMQVIRHHNEFADV